MTPEQVLFTLLDGLDPRNGLTIDDGPHQMPAKSVVYLRGPDGERVRVEVAK